MESKIFFLDIDYTILRDDGSIPEENIAAIREALDRGDYVSITTGRPKVSAMDTVRELGMLREHCFLISFNGSVIYDLATGNLLRDIRMPDEYAAYLFAEAERAGIYMQAYDEDGFLSARECPETEYYHNLIGTPYRIVPDLYHQTVYHTPKVLSLSLEDIETLHQFQRSHADWEEGKCVSYFSHPEMLEYSYYKVTKGSGIAFLEDYTGIAHANTIAVGDADNDLSMIEAAGIGVAMKNASDRVKALADYVTEHDNNEGGVAEVLRKFG